MFTHPEFKSQIHPVTLRFVKPELEDYYRGATKECYLRRFSPFYVLLMSLFLIACLAMTLAIYKFAKGDEWQAWASAIFSILVWSGIAVELLVNCFVLTQSLRTIPLVLFCFAACAEVNSLKLNMPGVRPG